MMSECLQTDDVAPMAVLRQGVRIVLRGEAFELDYSYLACSWVAVRTVQPLSCHHREHLALPHRDAHLFLRITMGAILLYLDQEWLQ